MIVDFLGILARSRAHLPAAAQLRAAEALLCGSPVLSIQDGGALWLSVRGIRVHAGAVASDSRGVAVVAGILDDFPESGARALAEAPTAAALSSWLAQRHGRFSGFSFDAATGRLRAVRDAIGHEPFYYALIEGGLAFSTSYRALRCALAAEVKPDPIGIADFLAFTHRDLERSLLEPIRRLPPAHWLAFESAPGPGPRLQTHRYWRLGDTLPELEGPAALALRDAVCDAVRAECMAAVKPALLLSGGLDSSSVGAAYHHLPETPKPLIAVGSLCSAIEGDEAAANETAYMKAFVAHYPETKLSLLETTQSSMLSEIESSVAAIGFPHRDIYSYEVREMTERAMEQGCDLILTGLGGDMFASSKLHAFFAYAFFAGDWRSLLRQARVERGALGVWGWSRLALGQILRPTLRRPAARLQPLRRFAKSYILGSTRLPLQPNFARETRFYARAQVDAFAALPQILRGVMNEDLVAVETGSLVHMLEYFSALGRHLGVRLSSPLLDRRTIECVAAAPLAERRQGPGQRSLIRNGFGDWLPELIAQRRSKGNFTAPATARVDSGQVERLLRRLEASPELDKFVDVPILKRLTRRALGSAATPAAYIECLLPLYVANNLASFLHSTMVASTHTSSAKKNHDLTAERPHEAAVHSLLSDSIRK